MTTAAITSTVLASSAAAPRSNMPYQTCSTPTETVVTLKYCTVAKSVSVSMATRAAPAARAGRANGNSTRRAAAAGDRPSVRAAW